MKLSRKEKIMCLLRAFISKFTHKSCKTCKYREYIYGQTISGQCLTCCEGPLLRNNWKKDKSNENVFKILSRILLALIIISAAFAILVYTLHAFAYLFISVVMLFAGAVM